MNALSLGLGEAEAEGINCQRWDAKQLHGCANQTGCNHIVYKECAVVRKKHAPATRKHETCELPAAIFRRHNTLGMFYYHQKEFLLEFDILLIQEIDIKEPCEEQVQTTERI